MIVIAVLEMVESHKTMDCHIFNWIIQTKSYKERDNQDEEAEKCFLFILTGGPFPSRMPKRPRPDSTIDIEPDSSGNWNTNVPNL